MKEGMRNQAGERGETEEARAESGAGEATVRRKREEWKGRNSRLSSWRRTVSGRKEANRKRKMPEARAEGKYLWNGCGSEAGKSERKRTAKPSTGTWKEGMRNQAGEKGESLKAKAEGRTGEAAARQGREEKERKKQKAE